MRKTKLLLAASCTMAVAILTSCGGGNKLTPEDEVRNYGKYFVEKLSANQLDSLKTTYPEIVTAEAFAPVQSDTILVVETTPGQYDVTLAEGVMLKVNRSEDGTIKVAESKGLFAFPEDKMDIAKKTGMWDESLSDVQLNERMKDEDFFRYMSNKRTNSTKNIIVASKKFDDGMDWSQSMDMTKYHLVLTNTTDVPISGSDYKINWKWYSWDEEGYSTDPGEDIEPHGKVTIRWEEGGDSGQEFKGIIWNLSDEEMNAKFSSYTGTEYQDYLNSKK